MGSTINLADKGILLSPEDARFHREQVSDLLSRHSTRFPGAQPVSFARKHLDELLRDDYFLCEKTDGIRCLLYLTHFIDPQAGGVELQLLIDRKNDYYAIERGYLHIPPPDPANPQQFQLEKFHIGTLLDGELVLDTFPDGRTQLNYLIFDCLALDGDNIMNRDYSVRIGKMKSQIYNPWKAFAAAWPDEAKVQPFQLKLKEWQLSYGMEVMFKEIIPKLRHGNDGLILTCVSTPYVAGTDQHILKWKPPHENTIDFKLQLGAFPVVEFDDGTSGEDWDAKPLIELLVYHGGDDYRHFANLSLTDAEWEAMKGMNQLLDWKIIECFRDPTSGSWRPKVEADGTPRFRDDKTHANHFSVVQSVLSSIEDAVSEQDLLDVAPRIKAAWKQREKEKRERTSQHREH